MVLNRPLVVSRHQDNIFDSRSHTLFYHVLDNRLVDNRQHLLGHRLGLGQESSAKPSRRNNRFSHLLLAHSVINSFSFSLPSSSNFAIAPSTCFCICSSHVLILSSLIPASPSCASIASLISARTFRTITLPPSLF